MIRSTVCGCRSQLATQFISGWILRGALRGTCIRGNADKYDFS